MPPALADLARKASLDFLKEYSGYLHLFEQEAEVADGVTVSLTGGHTPGHSVVRVQVGERQIDVRRRRNLSRLVRPSRVA